MEACAPVLLARGRPCNNLKEAAEQFRALLSSREVFGNENPVDLEIGCGNGAFIAELAKREPDRNFYAVEVCSNVVLTAMERIMRENIPNVRFLNIPAEILPCYIPEGSAEKIYLNFSTPLPEPNRAKQRLTSPRFLEIYRALLKEGGRIEQKTDSGYFFDYSLEQYALCGFEATEVTRDLHRSEYAAGNIVTEYEANFLAQGKPIFRAAAIKK